MPERTAVRACRMQKRRRTLRGRLKEGMGKVASEPEEPKQAVCIPYPGSNGVRDRRNSPRVKPQAVSLHDLSPL